MRVAYRALWLPKRGSAPDEYEDAYFPELSDGETSTFRCAVADGATETSFSGLWARILTEGYVKGETSLEALQKDWLSRVSGLELPWYAEQKLESGAYAALVGLTLEEVRSDDASDKAGGARQSLAWTAEAVGDCCLFHIRKGVLLESFPLSNWQDFNSRPLLLSSRAAANKDIEGKRAQGSGEARSEDVFYLLSDAISAWFLRRHEESGDAVQLLEGASSQEELEALCQKERSCKDATGRAFMTNDDVTFVRVSLS